MKDSPEIVAAMTGQSDLDTMKRRMTIRTMEGKLANKWLAEGYKVHTSVTDSGVWYYKGVKRSGDYQGTIRDAIAGALSCEFIDTAAAWTSATRHPIQIRNRQAKDQE